MKQNFHSAMELVPKGVIVTHCNNQEIAYANQETYKMLNVIHKSDMKEALEKYVMKLKHNETMQN